MKEERSSISLSPEVTPEESAEVSATSLDSSQIAEALPRLAEAEISPAMHRNLVHGTSFDERRLHQRSSRPSPSSVPAGGDPLSAPLATLSITSRTNSGPLPPSSSLPIPALQPRLSKTHQPRKPPRVRGTACPYPAELPQAPHGSGLTVILDPRGARRETEPGQGYVHCYNQDLEVAAPRIRSISYEGELQRRYSSNIAEPSTPLPPAPTPPTKDLLKRSSVGSDTTHDTITLQSHSSRTLSPLPSMQLRPQPPAAPPPKSVFSTYFTQPPAEGTEKAPPSESRLFCHATPSNATAETSSGPKSNRKLAKVKSTASHGFNVYTNNNKSMR
eukprot:gene27851-4023_t